MPYSIMIDAGHGGRDPGAVYNGRQEKDDTLALALAVGEILQERGVDVLYTRTTDVYESPYQKAMEANEAGVDFFVSLHRNSNPTPNSASGVESLVYDKSGIKLQMAENINEQLETLGFVNLGVKERPGLVVLRRTNMLAVLVEAGFINSDTDNQLFDDHFDSIALAIAEGILDTLQMNGELEPSRSSYTVQAGAFRNGAYASRLQQELLDQDFPAVTSQDGGLYRVTVGTYPTIDEAAAMERRLKRAGYQTVIVQG
ncbi:N-acetylmuramoyl-L-alanine amidase [Ruminococcus sp. CLA-AA-H200]|uniref:N-acetylmuramoyl-L-alanine amidase n=1 Tax=Ruminococcus turbiniformis TaxID=2881258 RepID=A0ABS8G3B2_9FIRM|nr:N-acetylmuramoyl-L-alanine amidase [Ruminococcus turbiniformis]MCC2255877.1 N-acetylmuramoyl-L-alanine amidase [Ruminococcus turbiniformis]